jgi:hypothetical protein
MQNELFSKETIKKLMTIKGEVRGVVFRTDKEYILKEKGKQGLEQVEAELERAGAPFKYEAVQTMDFYPVGLRIVSLLAIKKVFNMSDKEVESMGIFATKVSFIIKLFIRYFLSLKRVFFKEAPKIWKKHWTFGELIPKELNETKKYGVIVVKDFHLHPVFCTYLRGYFCGIMKMVVKSDKITCEEKKCGFTESGKDKSHEFLLKW